MKPTYLGERSTDAVLKAGNQVESFIGVLMVVDATGLGAAAHRVKFFPTNFHHASTVQASVRRHAGVQLNSILNTQHSTRICLTHSHSHKHKTH